MATNYYSSSESSEYDSDNPRHRFNPFKVKRDVPLNKYDIIRYTPLEAVEGSTFHPEIYAFVLAVNPEQEYPLTLSSNDLLPRHLLIELVAERMTSSWKELEKPVYCHVDEFKLAAQGNKREAMEEARAARHGAICISLAKNAQATGDELIEDFIPEYLRTEGSVHASARDVFLSLTSSTGAAAKPPNDKANDTVVETTLQVQDDSPGNNTVMDVLPTKHPGPIPQKIPTHSSKAPASTTSKDADAPVKPPQEKHQNVHPKFRPSSHHPSSHPISHPNSQTATITPSTAGSNNGGEKQLLTSHNGQGLTPFLPNTEGGTLPLPSTTNAAFWAYLMQQSHQGHHQQPQLLPNLSQNVTLADPLQFMMQ